MSKHGKPGKKTHVVPPDLIARVKRIFKAKPDTEAVEFALRELSFMDDVNRALRVTSGKISDYKPLRSGLWTSAESTSSPEDWGGRSRGRSP